MTRRNIKTIDPHLVTHEGAPAKHISLEQQLERSLMACMLWENEFYEDGESIATRIARAAAGVPLSTAAALARRARDEMYLRHAPLWVVVAMAQKGGNRIIGDTLAHVIQRPDEIAEFLALYWQEEARAPLPAQVKRGLALAFQKFNAYQLAKWDKDGAVRLRDVLRLVHAKPKDDEQGRLFASLVNKTHYPEATKAAGFPVKQAYGLGEYEPLPSPETWENRLSRGENKREVWESMLSRSELGGLALLRNLRNMTDVNVDETLVRDAIARNPFKKVLPFRFVAAAKAAPQFEDALDEAFLRVMADQPKLPGRTVVVIDVSGSMYGSKVSAKSDMNRAYAACALAAIMREVCENPIIYATAGNDWRKEHKTQLVPARRGLALVDAVYALTKPLGGGGIFLTPVCEYVRSQVGEVERMVVITDEQDCAAPGEDSPVHAKPVGEKGHNYLINVASYKNGIGYGQWTHIDGFSEAVVKYILAAENATQPSAMVAVASKMQRIP